MLIAKYADLDLTEESAKLQIAKTEIQKVYLQNIIVKVDAQNRKHFETKTIGYVIHELRGCRDSKNRADLVFKSYHKIKRPDIEVYAQEILT